MFIKEEPIETVKFYLNINYNGGKIFAIHEIKRSYEIEVLSSVKRRLSIIIETSFIDKSNNTLISESVFNKEMLIEVTNEPNNEL